MIRGAEAGHAALRPDLGRVLASAATDENRRDGLLLRIQRQCAATGNQKKDARCAALQQAVAFRGRMARRRVDFGTLLATGIVAFGLGMVAASSAQAENEARRAAFRKHLELELGVVGLTLLDLTIGRTQGNAPFWNVTLKDQIGQLRTVRVELPFGADPYGHDSRALVVQNTSLAA
jgi:hypothetical protein